jgi:hypothetical protein
VALFVALLKDRSRWNRPQEPDWKAGERERLGKDAGVGMLTREELLKEALEYVGEFLPGGAEVIGMGLDHPKKGMLSWEKLSTEELVSAVSDLRAGRRGEPPQYMTPQQAARVLGGESVKELIQKASDA